MSKLEENSASKLPPRKERFQILIKTLQKHFKPEHFYEFYQIANRYMRNSKYLTEEMLQKIENAIRNETVDLFFDYFVDSLRITYKQDADLFYSIIGYLFSLGNDTYLLELFLEFEIDQTLKNLIQLLEAFPTFEAVKNIYAQYIDAELFRKIISALYAKKLFLIPNVLNPRTFTQAIVLVYVLTNVVYYPRERLIALQFEEFVNKIFD